MGQLNLTSDNTIIIMRAIAILSPVMDLVQNAFVQEKVEEVARFFYFSDSITFPAILPGLILGALLLLLLIPLAALLFQPAASGGATSYGAPEESYGAPSPGYGAPEETYGAPSPGYGAPGYRSSN